jgi:hypothetical protein
MLQIYLQRTIYRTMPRRIYTLLYDLTELRRMYWSQWPKRPLKSKSSPTSPRTPLIAAPSSFSASKMPSVLTKNSLPSIP